MKPQFDNLSDRELLTICIKTNNAEQFCKDESFWKKRYLTYYKSPVSVPVSWKNLYMKRLMIEGINKSNNLPEVTQLQKSKVYIKYLDRHQEIGNTTFIQNGYGYNEILNRLLLQGQDTAPFIEDISSIVEEIKEILDDFLVEIQNNPQKTSDKLDDLVKDHSLEEMINRFINPTVPFENIAQVRKLVTEFYQNLLASTTSEQKTSSLTGLINKWKANEDLFRTIGIFFALNIHTFGDAGNQLIEKASELEELYQDWMEDVAEHQDTFSEHIKIKDNLLVIPAGTLLFKGVDKTRLKPEYEERMWLAFDLLVSYSYGKSKNIPTDIENKFRGFCETYGGVKVYKVKEDIELINLSLISNILELRKAMQNYPNILEAFEKSYKLDDEGKLSRYSFTDTDYLWAEWLCKYTNYPGYGADKIEDFSPEIMICRPDKYIIYLGYYTYEDLGINFCVPEYIDSISNYS